MARATTPVKRHDVAHAVPFPGNVHEMVWRGEQLCKAVHSRPFTMNLPVYHRIEMNKAICGPLHSAVSAS